MLIAVLLLHRTQPREAVLAGMEASLRLERLDADLVAVEARRHLEPTQASSYTGSGPTTAANGAADVVGDRPPPSLLDYDTLLAAASVAAADELAVEQIA